MNHSLYHFERMLEESLFEHGKVSWIAPIANGVLEVELFDGSTFHVRATQVEKSVAEAPAEQPTRADGLVDWRSK